MIKYVKLFPLFFCVPAKAQLTLKISDEISPVLSRVIHDYPNYFSNITGDTLEQEIQFTNYACTLKIKDELPGIITQYGEAEDHVYSWKNVLLETENFEEAKRKFHLYYEQIRKTTTIVKGSAIRLVADYTEPDDNKKFNDIIFDIKSEDDVIKNAVIDLSLQNEMSEWKITVSLYSVDDEHEAKQGDTDE